MNFQRVGALGTRLGQSRKGLKVAFIFLILFVFACGKQEQQPNIIFIMTDDHASQAISAYGSTLIQTPNIDRLASEGTLFENSFVTNSICAPSRAVLLTGKYSHLNGLRDNRDRFDGSQVTFPKILQKAGYQTAIVGKWHLKTEPTGFDYWNILIGQGAYYNPTMLEMGDTTRHTGYVTNIITDLAIESIQKRDKDKPFALLYHHKAPHRNWMPDSKHFDMFKDVKFPVPETFYDDYKTRSAAAREQDMRIDDMFLGLDMKLQPGDYKQETGSGGSGKLDPNRGWASTYERMNTEQRAKWDAHYDAVNKEFREAQLTGRALSEWKYQRYMQDYLRCIASVDENIGRLLDYLDDEGLTENTIVVYTSDQGFYLGEHGWYDKRFMYEQSLRMPLIMRYPKEIAAGQVTKQMALNLDFAPTFLDYAGAAVPADMQGASLRQVARGENPDGWRSSMYYHYYEYPHGWHSVKQHYGVRTEQYKLIHFYNDIDAWELYDLQADPKEINNVYGNAEYAEIQQTLHAELKKLRAQYGDEK